MENSTYKIYILDRYLITYDPGIEVELFSCEQYYGITFLMEDGQYDILHNKDMGDRINITLKNGYCSDIPFKPETFSFLPKGVKAQKIG